MARRGIHLDIINPTIGRSVSPESLARWMDLYTTTRDVVRDPATYEQRGRPLAVTHEEADFILAALELEPTLYIDELQSHIQAMTGMVHPLATITDELRVRLQLTKKTARTVHPSQCPVQRAHFTSRVGAFPPSYLVFMDECAVSLGTHSRDRAWAIRGRRTQRIPKPLTSARVSVLPAVSLTGMLGVIAHEGSMLRADVEYFLEEVLMPVMGRFPGPNSVLVLDNAQVHHGGRVREICEVNGVLMIYLPPYSPDFNPIEKVFSVLKSGLKRAQILTGTDDDPEIIMDFLATLVTPRLMEGLFYGSGYSA
ncbi:uncharacterized protein PGTG_20969 [Puccinia graminis f. sp. tritici CRL 75-36-700-3]|uniref:Tc1-like transposase DDE domain-containing protein n=1 Tax=Puccinia graminis f. sp. tritici (strain CRL 75-36-700-3 / race SCCL) TaxID=418459 RepID=H6QQ23_PUCGT|nr:uncharacterized protein PGTG_20969 [Puccinia graminis f. sp. tritici CRL 75-36-700-3]EHS64506.1 hypothetical protein PGTG_20969 [Puccinia graminis f. sp. tritici CRL 75-36-700-3]